MTLTLSVIKGIYFLQIKDNLKIKYVAIHGIIRQYKKRHKLEFNGKY